MEGKFKILSPAEFTPELEKEILDLGMRTGIWQHSDIDYYKDQFKNSNNISIINQESDGKVKGYILAKPHNEAVDDYALEDPLMKKSIVPMYYVDIVMAKKNKSSIGMQLIYKLIKEANRRGVSRFSFHCRVATGLSEKVQNLFGAEVLRRIDDYVDCSHEPSDYIETTVKT